MTEHREWLLRYAQDGDAEAFNELVREYSGMVYATCLRVTRNTQDAEDAAQKSFLELARKARSITTSVSGWLHATAVNQARSAIRSNVARRLRETTIANESAADGAISWEQLEPFIDDALEQLSPDLRVPLVLHYLQGKSQAEVAHALDVDQSTVSRRIDKGLIELRGHLSRVGVIVPLTLLAQFLSEQACMAAPSSLLATLGKMALAGSALTTIGSGAAVVGGIHGLGAKLAAVTAMALIIGTTAFFTLRQSPTSESPLSNASLDTNAVFVTAAQPVPHGGSSLAVTPAMDGDASTLIHGRVVDVKGNSVAGADVVLASAWPKKELVRLTTDEQGGFELVAMPPEAQDLFAFRSGVGIAFVMAVTVDLLAQPIVLKPMGSISGCVYDKDTGEGITNLCLGLLGTDMTRRGSEASDLQWTRASSLFPELNHMVFPASAQVEAGPGLIRTDEYGRFVIHDIRFGRYSIYPRPYESDYACGDYYSEIAVNEGNNPTNINLLLVRGGTISGTVRGTNGLPLQRVNIMPEYPDKSKSRFTYSTGEDGTYRLRGLPAGYTYTLTFAHPDYSETYSAPLVLSDTSTLTCDIQMEAGHTVFGRLSDDEGKPIAGIRLSSVNTAATTGSNGAFALYHIGPGNHRIWSTDAGRKGFDVGDQSFVMPEDGDLDLQVIFTRKKKEENGTGFLSGRVTDEQGAALGNIEVALVAVHDGSPLVLGAVTDAQGMYRFEGLKDAARLSLGLASQSGYASAGRDGIKVNSTGVDFTLKKLFRLQGQVLDSDTGKPIPAFEIQRPVSVKNSDYFESGWIPLKAEDGRFNIDDMSPGDQLEIRAKGYAYTRTGPLSPAPGTTVTDLVIRLVHGEGISGSVVDDVTGKPAVGVLIRVCKVAENCSLRDMDMKKLLTTASVSMKFEFTDTTITDDQGHFRFESVLPTLDLTLVAWGAGFGPQIVPKVRRDALMNGTYELRLAREGRLSVRILNLNDDGRITLKEKRADDSQPPYTDTALILPEGNGGRCELGGLPSGLYQLTLENMEGEQLGVFPVDIEAGLTRALELDGAKLSSQFGAIDATFADMAENHQAYVWVKAMNESASVGMIRYGDLDGNVRVSGLPPGLYAVWACFPSTEQERVDEYLVTVKAGETLSLDSTAYVRSFTRDVADK